MGIAGVVSVSVRLKWARETGDFTQALPPIGGEPGRGRALESNGGRGRGPGERSGKWLGCWGWTELVLLGNFLVFAPLLVVLVGGYYSSSRTHEKGRRCPAAVWKKLLGSGGKVMSQWRCRGKGGRGSPPSGPCVVASRHLVGSLAPRPCASRRTPFPILSCVWMHGRVQHTVLSCAQPPNPCAVYTTN